MSRRQGTYYKALLLLTVFSLNTVVSFAGSQGGLFHNLQPKNTVASATSHHDDQHSDKGGHTYDHGSRDQHHSEEENSLRSVE